MPQDHIPLPAGTVTPSTGLACAAAMYNADEDLTLVWCNDEFRTFMVEPYRSEGGVGAAYRDISPVGFAMHSGDMRAVAETGEQRSGQDRVFSVEDGILTFNWSISAPTAGTLLSLIRIEPPASPE